MQIARQRLLGPVLVFAAAVVSVISSLGAPLILRLVDRLHTSLGSAQWALTTPVLVAAIVSPVIGRLGDGRHRKTVLLVCLGGVVIGGGLAAVATTLPVLLAGRALQGLGLAILPLVMAVARDAFSRERAGRLIALLSVIGAAGVGLGYPLTGLIADHGGVAAAYWVGTAISALALVLAWWCIPSSRVDTALGRLDVPGAIVIAAALLLVLIPLDKASEWGWGSTRVVVMLIVGVLLAALWVAYELRVSDPLVDLRLVRLRPVLTANATVLLLGMVMYIAMAVVTQLVQLGGFGLGESVFVAGLTLLPMSILSASVSRTLPWVIHRIGSRPVIPLGSLVVALALVFFAVAHEQLWQIFVTMAILGIGLGYTFAAMPGLIVAAVPATKTSSAMGFYQVSRYIGFAVGSCLAITLLHAFGSGGALTEDAYRDTALIGAGLGVASALVAWILPGRTPVPAPSAEVEAFEVEEGMLSAAGLEDVAVPGGRGEVSLRQRP
jgi:MFS family permease